MTTGSFSAPGPGTGLLRLPRLAAAASGRLLALMVLTLFVVNVALHFPGTMNNDSIGQYRQAVSGQYADWHPPVMAWLWANLRVFGDGPAPLLILHLALYWLGFGLLADALRRTGQPRLALLVALGGAFPPFLYINAQVVKDVGMAATWIAAFGLLFWFRAQQRRVPVAVGLVVVLLVAYGTLVRTNAVFGLGPLVLYAFAPAHWLRNVRLMVAAVVVAVAAIPLSQVINRVAFDPIQQQPVQSLFLFDLMGIAVHTGDPRVLEPRATFQAGELRSCYTPYWWDSLSPWGRCAAKVNRPAGTELATLPDGLAQQWMGAIASNPGAYLAHRLKHFNSSLLFAVPLKHVRLTPEYRTDDPAVKPLEVVSASDVQRDLLRKNPFVWPVTWVTWACFLLWMLAREKPTASVQLARVLAVSSLGYSGAYLLIGVATDMRYHYWTLLSVLVGSLLVLPQLIRGLRTRSAPVLWGLGAVGLVVAIGVTARLMDWRVFV
jgi:hypothetical protein